MAFFFLAIALYGLPIAAGVDAMRLPARAWEASGNNRPLAIVGLVMACNLGAIYYFVRVRPEVRRANAGAVDQERADRASSPPPDGA